MVVELIINAAVCLSYLGINIKTGGRTCPTALNFTISPASARRRYKINSHNRITSSSKMSDCNSPDQRNQRCLRCVELAHDCTATRSSAKCDKCLQDEEICTFLHPGTFGRIPDGLRARKTCHGCVLAHQLCNVLSDNGGTCTRCVKFDLTCVFRPTTQGTRVDLLRLGNKTNNHDESSMNSKLVGGGCGRVEEDTYDRPLTVCVPSTRPTYDPTAVEHKPGNGEGCEGMEEETYDRPLTVCVPSIRSKPLGENCEQVGEDSQDGSGVPSTCHTFDPFTTLPGVQWIDEVGDALSVGEHQTVPQNLYRGFDASDINTNTFGFHYDFLTRNQVGLCGSFSKGGGDVWYPIRPGELAHCRPTKRFTCPEDSSPLFVRATCIHQTSQCCHGTLVAFQNTSNKGKSWRFGIVNKVHFQNGGSISLWEWTGELNRENLVPDILLCDTWAVMLSHLEERLFLLKDLSLYFINQVSGPVPLGGSIRSDTRNKIDLGVQSSQQGPDRWEKVEKPSFHWGSLTIPFFNLTEECTGLRDLFVPNNWWNVKQKRKKMRVLHDHVSDDSDAWKWHIGSPKKIPAGDQLGMVVVAQRKRGKLITPSIAQQIPLTLKKSFNYGSIAHANDKTTLVQDFYCLSQSANKKLCDDYKDGLTLGDNIEEEIDSVLRNYAAGKSHTLFSTDKVMCQPTTLGGTFHGFTRLFAGGDAAPIIDETFQTCNELPHHTIHYKFARARDYMEYPALSIGFHQASFHQVKVQEPFVYLIEKAIGTKGTYASRCTTIHEGHLSFVGPRKVGIMNQPTVLEGPKEPVPSRDYHYWYHKNSSDHRYLPFLVSLINVIKGATTLAPYYFYRHLKQLHTVCNRTTRRDKFCPTAILTIDFYNSCHIDKHDLDNDVTNDMMTRLRKILFDFRDLLDKGVKVMKCRIEEVVRCIAHLENWGFCLPTTCCYQYLFRGERVQVYQWFMCPGLGTTHRIRNYWVHIFLGGLFSHCTSAPIYIVNGKAYFGKCPQVTMFAWGGN